MATPVNSMPLPQPKTKRGAATREKLLDAAEKVIGSSGFAHTAISDITREAGVAQGTFYLYFPAKEDVMRELVLRMGRRLRRHLTLSVQACSGRLEVEHKGIAAFLAFVRANPNLYRVVAESQFVDEGAYRRYYEDFARGYETALEAAMSRDEITLGDCAVRAWALMGIADMVGRRYALWDRRADIGATARAAYLLVAEGLRPKQD